MRRLLCPVLVLLAVAGELLAQDRTHLAQAIECYRAFVKQQMAADGIPGLSVGFFLGDYQWAEGFGYADLEHEVPATPRTSYRLASNTKSMTAVAVLQLAERGLVDLDAEVQRYVPYFPRKQWPVTVRQLLGHLGGISHYRNYEVEGRIKEHKDTREAIAIFADFDLVAEPGTRYHYSSYGYNLLGAVIEGAAKQRYGEYLRKHVWAPLGMDDTRMDNPEEVVPNRARGYRLVEGQLRNSEFVDISSRFAAGGTRSTVLDMLRYARGLDKGGVLSQQSLEVMYTAMTTREGRRTDYGMGWVVRPFNGHFCVYHTGGQPETRTLMFRLPRLNFALALAYNFEGADLFVYAERLLQLVLDERRITICAEDPAEQAICAAFGEVFDHGMAYFERYGAAVSADSTGLAKAFAYLNRWACLDSLRRNCKTARQKLQAGRHPAAEEAFVVVGSHMAQMLADRQGRNSLARYHREGALPFFADYCRTVAGHGGTNNLSPELIRLVTAWEHDWAKSCTPEVRQLVIAPFSDMEKTGRRLRAAFAGTRVKPDLTVELTKMVEYYVMHGREAEAIEAAHVHVELYPKAARAWLSRALADVCAGRQAKATEDIRRAKERDLVKEVVTASALRELAARLAEAGRWEVAAALVEAAIAEMPEEPALYQALADLHLRRARGYLQRAIEIDPTYETARETLRGLR